MRAHIAYGMRLPAAPGVCYLCKQPLESDRQASVQFILGKPQLVCRSQEDCRARRREAAEKTR
jgi:hypothetical protein